MPFSSVKSHIAATEQHSICCEFTQAFVGFKCSSSATARWQIQDTVKGHTPGNPTKHTSGNSTKHTGKEHKHPVYQPPSHRHVVCALRPPSKAGSSGKWENKCALARELALASEVPLEMFSNKCADRFGFLSSLSSSIHAHTQSQCDLCCHISLGKPPCPEYNLRAGVWGTGSTGDLIWQLSPEKCPQLNYRYPTDLKRLPKHTSNNTVHYKGTSCATHCVWLLSSWERSETTQQSVPQPMSQPCLGVRVCAEHYIWNTCGYGHHRTKVGLTCSLLEIVSGLPL